MHKIYLKEKRKRIFGVAMITFFFLLAISVVGTIFVLISVRKVLVSQDVEYHGSSYVDDNAEFQKNLFSVFRESFVNMKLFIELGGFQKPKDYLVLLQNNTELRPTGGFIGAYALVRVQGFESEILKIEDSYNLDRFSEGVATEPAPHPISKNLGVDVWYFRDSNWKADFEDASEDILRLYEFERRNLEAEPEIHIDGIVAVTPTVVEKFLAEFGPVTIEDKTYNDQNFIELLEYRVEYEYPQYHESEYERKDILGKIAPVLLKKMKSLSVRQKIDAVKIAIDSLGDKQILIFSKDPELEKLLKYNNWAGNIAPTNEEVDYISVVDANLGSLKTDLAMNRSISYVIDEEGDRAIASLEISYKHTAGYDWRTTRYHSHTRIYLPSGVNVISVSRESNGVREEVPRGALEVYEEYGKRVIALDVKVDPLTETIVRVRYTLPEKIQKTLEKGVYTLIVQKQPGTIAHRLTVDLSAYDVVQSWNTDLRFDRVFEYHRTNP
ncbi:MAG TPA: DUF4012 domain-containing protein [Patescibacteria group bacterium]|nr:DUF4012 domain-containing protein [Patescibacteria group bacterium]